MAAIFPKDPLITHFKDMVEAKCTVAAFKG
jgi:hypothetical protein